MAQGQEASSRKPAPVKGAPKRVSHVDRTRKLLRDNGWITQVVERRKPQSVRDKITGEWRQLPGGRTVDLYGIGDLMCVKPFAPQPLLVQICAESGLSSHYAKARAAYFTDGKAAHHTLSTVLPHFRFWIISWRAKPTKTGSGRRWIHRITEVAAGRDEDGYTRIPVIL